MNAGFNPVRVHARQRFWQILFPIILISLILLGGLLYLLLSGSASGDTISQWGDISLVLVILPGFLLLLLVLALLVGMIVLTSKIGPWVSTGAGKITTLLGQAQSSLQKGANIAALPIIKLNAWQAKLSALSASIHPQHKQRNES